MSLRFNRSSFEEYGFSEIFDIEQDVYKCVKKYSDKRYSVHYFDLNNNVERIKSFKEITNELIGKDYYKNSGAIQWNYYYYFVLDDTKAQEFNHSREKDLLEKNKSFARKFLYSESELFDYLKPFSFRDIISDESNKIDLLETWQKHLFEKGLQEIVFEKTLKSTLEKLQSKALPFDSFEIETQDKDLISKTTKENSIAELKLTNYRGYPLIRNYEFGRFNLIFGPNGTGKTSLFEAIELFYCGATKRSGGQPEENALIEVRFKGKTIFESYVPSKAGNYSLLNDRERNWYGRQSGKNKSLLYDSFNRFNFYNTDSAFLLAHENESEEDIERSFSALVLGDEVVDLEGKIINVLNEFTKENKRLVKRIDEIQNDIKSEEQKISKYSSSDDELKIKESALRNILNDKLKINISDLRDASEQARVVSILNEGKVNLDSILNIIAGTNIDGHDSYMNHVILLKKSFENIKKKEIEVKDSELRKIGFLNERETTSGKVRLLKNYLRYREDKHFKELGTHRKEFKKIIEAELLLKKQIKILSGLNLEILNHLEHSELLSTERAKHSEKMGNLNKESAAFKFKLEKIKEKIGRLDQILSEILVLGKDYGALNDRISSCPLCNQEINREDFLNALDRENDFNSDAEFEEIVKAVNNLRDEKNIIEKVLIFLQEIETAFGDSFALLRVSEIEGRIKDLNNEYEEMKKRILNLQEVQEYFNEREMNYEDFLAIERETELNFTESFKQVKVQMLNGKLKENVEAISKLDVEILDFDKNILKHNGELNLLFAEVTSVLGLVDKNLDLTNRLESILSAEKEVQHLSTVVENFKKMNFKDVRIVVLNIISSVDSWVSFISNYKSNFSLVTEAQKTLSAHNEKLTFVSSQTEVLSYIIDSLNFLNSQHGKKDALDKFIQKNRGIINAIFKKIHSPDEFLGLESSTLQLRRKRDGKDVTLNEVSTGQRSALAISVFLSLNLSLKNAPPVILIDDPVSFVDDMNILSFLDFLREVVLNGNRQIFFATANHKIAALIEKKFDFLGNNEFKKFDFHR
jgi:exonuclease SbcC